MKIDENDFEQGASASWICRNYYFIMNGAK